MNRWGILAVLFVARTGLGLQFQTVGSVSVQIARDFAITFAEVGTLIGVFMLPGLVLSLPTGYVGRYASDRALVCVGLACLATGGVLFAVGNSFALAVIGRLICGAGFVFCTVFFTKMVTDWFSGKEIATAMGILVMSWPLGIALGQAGFGSLAQFYHWQVAFHLASLFCVGGLLLVLLMYRPPSSASVNVAPQGQRLSGREFLLITLAALVWAAFNAAYVVYLSFAPLVLGQSGFGPIQAAAVASLASWVMMASVPACGQLADRSGRPDLVLYVCLSVGAVSLLLLPMSSLAVPMCILFGLLGMSPAGVIMALPGQAVRAENRALGMGVFFTWYFVVTAPAPIIAGWLYDVSGTATWPMYFAVALILATIACNLAFRLAQGGLPAGMAKQA